MLTIHYFWGHPMICASLSCIQYEFGNLLNFSPPVIFSEKEDALKRDSPKSVTFKLQSSSTRRLSDFRSLITTTKYQKSWRVHKRGFLPLYYYRMLRMKIKHSLILIRIQTLCWKSYLLQCLMLASFVNHNSYLVIGLAEVEIDFPWYIDP